MKKMVFFALLCASILSACGKYKAEMDYLTRWMPRGDRDTLSAEFLEHNVEYAMLAREEFPWAKALPDSIFLNEVLPYAVVDEKREQWRGKFYDIFAPIVRDAASAREAVEIINRDIEKTLGVKYNTNRSRTNQSPSESMAEGRATCTGLAILLVDALRSVGIPARFAGVPMWHDNSGNHSWTEVWIDGHWYFTEYNPDSKGLDNAWFVSRSGKADPADGRYSIWATSWRPTGDSFPMIWDTESNEVYAVNVSDRYIARLKEIEEAGIAAGTHVPVSIKVWRNRDAESAGASDGRVAVDVEVFRGTNRADSGVTAGPDDDMNNALTFALRKTAEYTLIYTDAKGGKVEMKVSVGEEPVELTWYME
jgi:hypothetical protein